MLLAGNAGLKWEITLSSTLQCSAVLKPEDFEDMDELGDIELANPELYEDDDQEQAFAPDRDDLPDDACDNCIGAELTLQQGDEATTARVKRRKLDDFGNAIRKANPNPILDARLHTLEYANGIEAECSANVIAENMWAQCDIDGNQCQPLEAIIDHKSDEHAVQRADGYVVVNGRKHMKKSTKGWELCIQWKDGSTSWERLADVKESNPIEVAEYSVARGIDSEPAFGWWVDCALRKRDRIISAIRKRVRSRRPTSLACEHRTVSMRLTPSTRRMAVPFGQMPSPRK
jgi:hypothetical protein